MPEHVVVTLLDDTIYDYPFVFMSDVGTVGFTPIEVERLRDEEDEYFYRFSVKAYPVGVNIAIYAMTH